MGTFLPTVSTILSCCLLLLSQCECRLRKIPKESYQISQGLSLELPCVTDQNDVACIWSRNGDFAPSGGRTRYAMSSQSGDCSIHIHNLTYPEDNAVWECQIPSLNLGRGNWPNTKVIVLTKPGSPKAHVENHFSQPYVTAEQKSNLSCESVGGNPMPRIEWFLNGANITANSTVSSTDSTITSRLSYVFTKANNGQSVQCKTVHPLLTQNVSVPLNVHYKPVVTVSRREFTVDSGSNIEVECFSDANPPAEVIWKPSIELPRSLYNMNAGKLYIPNVDRQLDGIEFSCSSQNSVDRSLSAKVKLNVLFGPVIRESIPKERNQQIRVGQNLRLECKFAGNPKPEIQWNFVGAVSDRVEAYSSPDGVLTLNNLTYWEEGEYQCEGTNFNSNMNKKETGSGQMYIVDVIGKPLFTEKHQTVFAYNGLNTRLQQTFCADPFPTKIYWKVGEATYDVDLTLAKPEDPIEENLIEDVHIKAGRLVPLPNRVNKVSCYTVALIVSNTDQPDQGDYKIVVQNRFGIAESVVTLEFNSLFSATVLISIGMFILIVIVALTTFALLFIRRRTLHAHDEHASPEKIEKGEKIAAVELN